MISSKLSKSLLKYCENETIQSGVIFRTRTGKPLNRSNIWRMMNSLCEDAKVDKKKVFPHNLRHLFALKYYQLEKDIVRLADILGHSNIETTRIYTATQNYDYERIFEKMNLVQNN